MPTKEPLHFRAGSVSYKNILYNSITISLPKNTIQFFLGVILFWLLTGMPDPLTTFLGLSGFILTYSSVYLINDIFDHEEDMRDREKRKWKLIAGGTLSFRGAKILTSIFILSGLAISILVNRWFFLMMVVLLLLNFLHSSPNTRFKKSLPKTSINITIIQFLKYSSGWFALTSNLSHFPFWLILAFSIVYTISYIIYKFKCSGHKIKRNKRLFGLLTGVGIISYTISFILYGFPLSLIILVFVPTVLLLLLKQVNWKYHRVSNMIMVEYLLLPIIVISFLLLVVNPIFAMANDDMVSSIDTYAEKISDKLPGPVIQSIENISNELKKYESLEDIEREINLSLK